MKYGHNKPQIIITIPWEDGTMFVSYTAVVFIFSSNSNLYFYRQIYNISFYPSDGQIHRRKSRRQTPQLWSFLLNSLCDSKLNPSVIEWVDKRKGIFKLSNNKKIAQLWGERTGKDPKRPMNYEKFSRAIR